MFDNLVLPLPVIPGLDITVGYNTLVTTTGSNVEQRLIGRGESRLSANLSGLVLTEEETEALRNFYRDRRGEQRSFKYKLFHDYKAANIIGSGVYSQGVVINRRLYKMYVVGERRAFKTITKPDITTFSLYNSSNTLIDPSTYSLDSATGELTLPPSELDATYWSGEFYHHVRFEESLLDVTEVSGVTGTGKAVSFHTATPYYSFDSLRLIEVVEGREGVETVDDFLSLDQPFQLPYTPKIDRSSTFKQQTVEFDSGQEIIDNRSDEILKYSYGSLLMTSAEELDYILTFFNVCRGKLLDFELDGITQRFDFNELNLTLEGVRGINNDVFLFRLSDITTTTFKDFKTTFFTDSILSQLNEETYVEFVLDTSGSMTSVIPTIQNVRDELYDYMLTNVFNNDVAATDAHVLISNRADERWLRWAANDPGTFNLLSGTTKPNFTKLVRLIWVNESTPYGVELVPNSVYNQDYNTYITEYNNNPGIEQIHVVFIPGINGYFGQQVRRAIAGVGGFVELHSYGWSSSIVTINTPVSYYINYLEDLNFNNSGVQNVISSYSFGLNDNIVPYTNLFKIERRDGVVLGFTNYDKRLTLDGIDYILPQDPKNLEFKTDLSVNNTEVIFLNADAITEADIVAGLYDDCEITIYIAHVGDTSINHVRYQGLVGEIRKSDIISTFEVSSTSSVLLNRKSNRRMSPTCSYDFGDSNCGFDINSLLVSSTISAITNNSEFTVSAALSNNYTYGRVEFTSGNNATYQGFILSQNGSTLRLFSSMPFPLTSGDQVNIYPGCNKTPNACRGYNNFLNFDGFPTGGNFMPGNDFVYNPVR